MKTILITGCAGLLGSNFSRYLLSKGYIVIGIDNFFDLKTLHIHLHVNLSS